MPLITFYVNILDGNERCIITVIFWQHSEMERDRTLFVVVIIFASRTGLGRVSLKFMVKLFLMTQSLHGGRFIKEKNSKVLLGGMVTNLLVYHLLCVQR